MFAMTDNNHHNSGRIAVWLKPSRWRRRYSSTPVPKRFFKPPWVGTKGRVGVRLDGRTQRNRNSG